MFVQSHQSAAKPFDRLVVSAGFEQVFGELAAAVDAVRHAQLPLGVAQIAAGIDRTMNVRDCAACPTAAHERGQNFHDDVCDRAHQWQHRDGQYPVGVASGLEHMHHQRHLDRNDKDVQRHGFRSLSILDMGRIVREQPTWAT